MMYFVTTSGGYRIGPYEDYCNAFFSAIEQFGFEGWIISSA